MNIDGIYYLISENPLWATLFIILPAIGVLYSVKTFRSFKMARWIVVTGQYQPLTDAHLEYAINDAQQKGKENQFLNLLRIIRQQYGHNGVKIGHLYWIWHQLESEVPVIDETSVPSFDKKL